MRELVSWGSGIGLGEGLGVGVGLGEEIGGLKKFS